MINHLWQKEIKKYTQNNFRRSSHKKFSRLNNGINQFNTNINVNSSLALGGGQSGQTGQLASSSAVGFHKLLNDSKWFEQLQVTLTRQLFLLPGGP